jgi:hypothetical protein
VFLKKRRKHQALFQPNNRSIVYLISQLGQVVKSFDAKQNEFAVSTLPPGMYVFIIEDYTGKRYSEQFVKRWFFD